MESLILKTSGEKPDFDLIEAEIPDPVPGFVIVKVSAVGLCHHDISVIDGTLSRGVKKDVILGHEISGEVYAIGNGVQDVNIGDKIVTTLTSSCGACEVCISGNDYQCPNSYGFGHGIDGGLSEYISVSHHNLVKLPDNFDLIKSSLMACPIGVVIHALRDVAKLSRGINFVVYGVGGGLGVHALQVASHYGAETIGFTHSENKVADLTDLGLGHILLMDQDLDSSELVMAFTEDVGANIVFNPVGSSVFQAGIRSLSDRGTMLVLGEIEGNTSSMNLAEIMFRNASVTGSTGASITHIESAVELMEKGFIDPIVGAQFALDEIMQAYDMMKSSSVLGRVVIKI